MKPQYLFNGYRLIDCLYIVLFFSKTLDHTTLELLILKYDQRKLLNLQMMKTASLRTLLLILTICSLLTMPSVAIGELSEPWVRINQEGEKILRLHFFWSKECPHCRKAKPFLKELTRNYDWFELISYEISENEENARIFASLAQKSGEGHLGVPAFLFCGKIMVGYLDDQTTGSLLRDRVLECRQSLLPENSMKTIPQDQASEEHITVPLFGKLDPSKLSLPVLTFLIAGMDAFNPCAFFVLLLLLSLLVTAKNRKRMLIIGGIFVFFEVLQAI